MDSGRLDAPSMKEPSAHPPASTSQMKGRRRIPLCKRQEVYDDGQ